MFTRITQITTLALAGFTHLTPLGVSAQESPSTESITARIAALEASGESPEALDTLRAAADTNAQSKQLAEASEELQRRIDLIPDQLAERQSSLSATPPPAPAETELTAMPLDQLDASLKDTKASLELARTKQQNIETELQQRDLKLKGLPATNTDLTTSLENLSTSIAAAPPLPDSPSATEIADRANQLAQQALLRQTIAHNQRELEFINAAAEITAIDLSLVEREVKRLTAAVEIIQQVADSKRRIEAENQAAQAQSEADFSTDAAAVAALAKENADLAGLRAGDDGLTARLRKAHNSLTNVTSELDLISEYYRSAKRRVDLVTEAGFSLGETTGELLRYERKSLPDVRELRSLTRTDLNNNTADGLELIKLEKQRRDLLLNSESMIDQIVATIPAEDEKARTQAEKAARRLLDFRLAFLDQLVADYRTLTHTVGATNRKRQTLISQTNAYARLIDERVLWFRSAPAIDAEAIQSGTRSIATVASPGRWAAFFATIASDFAKNRVLWIAALLAVGLLVARRPAHKRQLEGASAIASRRTSRTFLPTAKALTYTALLSLPAPIALGFVALRHGGIGEGGIATGLYEVACQLVVFGFLRRVCYKDGLAVAHFRLPPDHTRILHVTLTRFLWFVVPAAFALGALDSPDGHPGGRLIFIATMLVFIGFILGLLKPSSKLIGSTSLRIGTFLFGVAAPLVLVAGAAAGYFYTVRELQWRLEASLSFVLLLLLISATIQRWFLVAHRRLAVAQAKKQRRASAESSQKSTDAVALTPQEIESATVDITKIKDQTRQLLQSALAVALAVGLWGIWSQVLPALNILDDIHLWPDTTEVAATDQDAKPDARSSLSVSTPTQGDNSTGSEQPATTAPPAGGPPASDSLSTRPIDPNFGWVTLADVALSLLAFILTYLAAKNIPGLLDISLLSRLDLKPGGSFTVTASARYLIVLVGVILAFAQIGITWSKVQWIAAAVTVGIGFGLQEVFANFVAGLILLFERPIRLGDFVTVGPVSGQVTRIEIRATTIRDFSNKELIVPNKEFITGQLVNWTLTDSVIRVEVPVGIAYGSDTELARKLLEEIGQTHRLTIPDPPAQAVFLNFGASSLDFELRVHISSAQDLITVRNDLHFAIDKAFREHGIEIAFPQTDIHIRSMPDVTT